MEIRSRLRRAAVRQFHRPSGWGGRLSGWVMGSRRSNVRRSRWAVGLLDLRPADHVIEFGCGPGVALAEMAGRVPRGVVVGVDHSWVMIRQARRRNAAACRAGRVQLVYAPVERYPAGQGPFDAALAVNTATMWPEPAARLREIGGLLRPGGVLAVVSQPRCAGATAGTSVAAGQELSALLVEAGFGDVRVESLALRPPAVCVRAVRPEADAPYRSSAPRAAGAE